MKMKFLKSAVFSLCLLGVSYSGSAVAKDAQPETKKEAPSLKTQERGGAIYDVVLFGHEFTLDSFMAEGSPLKWEEVGYLVPQIFPTIQDQTDKRDVIDISVALYDARKKYARLSKQQIDVVAAIMEEDGHLGFAEGYDPSTLTIQSRAGDSFVLKDSKDRRVEYIAGHIATLLGDGGLQDAVEAYNQNQEKAGKRELPLEIFANVELFYKYSQAAYGLYAMLEASPQMRSYSEHFGESPEDHHDHDHDHE